MEIRWIRKIQWLSVNTHLITYSSWLTFTRLILHRDEHLVFTSESMTWSTTLENEPKWSRHARLWYLSQPCPDRASTSALTLLEWVRNPYSSTNASITADPWYEWYRYKSMISFEALVQALMLMSPLIFGVNRSLFVSYSILLLWSVFWETKWREAVIIISFVAWLDAWLIALLFIFDLGIFTQ